MAYDQVTVAHKLADLAARPPIHIPERQGVNGMQRVDRWMTDNTKTVYGLHLTTSVNCVAAVYCLTLCCCAPSCQLLFYIYCSVCCAQSLPILGLHTIYYCAWVF